MPTFILDTNVLVYWFDREDEEKHAAAERFIDYLLQAPASYAVAEQNLREFAAVMTRKTGMKEAEFAEAFKTIQTTFLETLEENAEDYAEAFRLARQHRAPYCDALLTATMR